MEDIVVVVGGAEVNVGKKPDVVESTKLEDQVDSA